MHPALIGQLAAARIPRYTRKRRINAGLVRPVKPAWPGGTRRLHHQGFRPARL